MNTYLIDYSATWVGFATLGAGDRLVVTPGGALVLPGQAFDLRGTGAAGIGLAGYVWLDNLALDDGTELVIGTTGQFVSDAAEGITLGSGAVAAIAGSVSVLNGTGLGLTGADLTLSGQITAQIGIAASAAHLTISGTVSGTTRGLVITGAAEVDVTGTLLGGIAASGTGDVRIANSGSIGGGIAVGTTAGSFVLINGGTVMGDITAGASTDRISGSGLITGDIALGAGADVFAGRVLGDLDMGLGDDRVEARGGAVQGVIHDAGGNDLYRIDGAVEIHDLGTGRDTVEAWSDTALAPGLEVLILKGAGDLVGTGNALANRISGTVGDNLLRGEAGADQIYGGLGADTLRGGAGADRLFGGADEDRLNGGAGADLLTGGTGADLFVFGPGSGIGDEIRDFDSLDRIDLRAYGALHVVSALDGTSAQVAISIAGGMTHLAIDADGDGLAEASVALWGAPLLTSDDLLMV